MLDVAHLLFRSALRNPEAPLWLDGAVTIAYREGARRIASLASRLHELGSQRDRVAILMPNRFEALESFIATMAAGMAAMPMNRQLHPDEHAFIIEDATAAVVIFDERFRDHLGTVRARLDCVKHWVCAGTAASQELSYEELVASEGTRADLAIEPDDLAWLFYTSGTTGQPKGAMESHRNLLTMVQQMLIGVVPDAQASDVVLHAAPTSHGSASVALAHIAIGAAQAFPPHGHFNAEETFAAIERYRATTMFLAPTMIHRLVQSDSLRKWNLSSLKTVIYGGGPMYVDQLVMALEMFGPVFVQIYGQGEAPMTISALPKAEHNPAELASQALLASAGRELPGVRIRIMDEHGQELGPGAVGEVTVKGDLVMNGYWNNDQATGEAIIDGWLHTGDLGYVDNKGYLFLTDRSKDLIISGGANIYPREVEEVLVTHPAVSEVSVVGAPDPEWGEMVVAFVVARSPVQAEELIEHCRARVASYKKPRNVVFVDALPKNANGKVLKKELVRALHERKAPWTS